MTKQNQEPGPGRSTSGAAFDDLRKQIAQRNEQASDKARKLRAARDRAQMIERRRWELL
jgi:hypothetical protein